MTTIEVTTQEALDRALADAEPNDIIVCVGTGPFNVRGSASVIATDSASVMVLDSASVWASGSASVRALGSASVIATDSVSVWAFGSASVTALEHVTVHRRAMSSPDAHG